MKKMTKQQIWENILNRMCCTTNPITRDRPCDSGLLCDRCNSGLIQDIYLQELERYGLTTEDA